MTTLRNPWTSFEISSSMVHEMDKEAFDLHNSRVTQEFQFLDHLAPEPWIGNKSANLLVLLANPGATRGDVARKKQKGADRINELSIQNLRGQIKDFPHFFFNPELEGTDGHTWYAKRFQHLILETSPRNLAHKVLSCELAPYHSFSWKKPRKTLPTQSFTYQLVADAMKRDAVIVIGRGRAEWFKNVPGLEKYKRYFQPSSSQCSYLSPNNYGKNYKALLEAIN
jgi:hypothetical protein